MKLTIAVIVFLVSVFLELVFIPRSFGVFLPLSFWTAAVVMAIFEPRQVLGFSLAAGFLKTLFLPALGGFLLILFIASALVVLLVRRFLDGAGFIYDFISLAAAVLSFEFFGFLLSGFFGPYGLAASGAYFITAFPKDILFSVIFILLAGPVLYLYELRQSSRQLLYV